MAFATARTRFYDPATGTAVGDVIAGNGQPREPTLRDAKKFGWRPAVSSIIRAAAAPGLEIWKKQQVLHAALTLPRRDGESLDDFMKRVIEDSEAQTQEAAERGRKLHTAIQCYAQGKPFDSAYAAHVDAVVDALLGYEVDLRRGTSERSFCTAEYGGTPDWYDARVMADFKSKDYIDPKLKAWDEQGMQLVAYNTALGGGRRLLNVFVGVNDKRVHVHEWKPEEQIRLLTMFFGLKRFVFARDRIEVGDLDVEVVESTARALP